MKDGQDVYHQLHNCFAKAIWLPGATLKHLTYYVVLFLVTKTSM